jgi:cephalosporin hydroxylase
MTVELRYSNSWFEHSVFGKRNTRRESTRELFERVLLPVKDKLRTVIEIGLSEGRSSLWLFEHIQPDRWLGIDPWRAGRRHHVKPVEQSEKNFWHNLTASGAACENAPINGELSRDFAFGKTVCRVAKATSQDYLRHAVDEFYPDHSVMLLCIDGDHSSQGTLTDLVLGWRKLKPGGYITVDDFDRRWHQARPNVHEAVLAFWQAYEHLCEKVSETRHHVVFRRKLDG